MAGTIVKGLLVGILGIVLMSCVSRDSPFVDDAGNPILSPPIPEDSNKAVVFLYRPGRLGRAAVSPPVVISGKSDLLVGKLPNSAYTWVAITPGKYEVKTSLHSLTGEERPSTTLATEGGKKYYVRVLIERFDSSVTSVNASEAENEMKSTQYIRPAQDHFIE